MIIIELNLQSKSILSKEYLDLDMLDIDCIEKTFLLKDGKQNFYTKNCPKSIYQQEKTIFN